MCECVCVCVCVCVAVLITVVRDRGAVFLEQLGSSCSGCQWPIPIRDFLVSTSPSVLIRMCLEA